MAPGVREIHEFSDDFFFVRQNLGFFLNLGGGSKHFSGGGSNWCKFTRGFWLTTLPETKLGGGSKDFLFSSRTLGKMNPF